MKGSLSYMRNVSLLFLSLIACNLYAGSPVWTVEPLNATQGSVPANVTLIVKYKVTNQSSKPKALKMKPISGLQQITTGAGVCGSIISLESKGASCILSLQVDGSRLFNTVQGGPVLCQNGNENQCYQPAQANILDLTPHPAVSVGDNLDGGVVACLGGGSKNLIAAPNDAGVSLAWGGWGTGTSAFSFDDGATNTLAILNTLGNNGGTDYPAKSCADYEVDSQGNTPCQSGNKCYKDWFLPALNQLICLYNNRVAVGNFQNEFYWSSTETTAVDAYIYNFTFNYQDDRPKSELHNFRCVRQI